MRARNVEIYKHYDTSPIINADDDVGVVHNIHKMLDEESCNFSSSAVEEE